ncbi:MAG: hypothetical protein J6D27_09170, partial [Ruminiclostridium sp.]|nr:hypothetical protein [Ruminiclostridium sp.]
EPKLYENCIFIKSRSPIGLLPAPAVRRTATISANTFAEIYFLRGKGVRWDIALKGVAVFHTAAACNSAFGGGSSRTPTPTIHLQNLEAIEIIKGSQSLYYTGFGA